MTVNDLGSIPEQPRARLRLTVDVHRVVSHISTASGRAWKEGRLDVTGAMMVLTLKIISAAACYQDGSKPDKVCLLRPQHP